LSIGGIEWREIKDFGIDKFFAFFNESKELFLFNEEQFKVQFNKSLLIILWKEDFGGMERVVILNFADISEEKLKQVVFEGQRPVEFQVGIKKNMHNG